MLDPLTLLRAMDGIHEEDVVMAGNLYYGKEKPIAFRSKRIVTAVLAAALILALGVTACAGWSIHAARQQELKEDLKIVENRAESYVEYETADTDASGLVLLSAVNDGEEQRVYLNVSPVSREEAACFPDTMRLYWGIAGTDFGGFAAPQLFGEQSLSGADEIRNAVLEQAYDEQTQTLTLQAYLHTDTLRQAMAELETDSVPLQVFMVVGDGEPRCFGTVSFAPTEEQRRVFDFGPTQYHDAQYDKDVELVALELTPFSAVWKLRYEDAEAFHQPSADWQANEAWAMLEDKVCMEAKLIFSDGSSFSTGGALACPFEDGLVNEYCGWGSAIDIDDVQKIVLGDLVLWEAA